MRQAIFSVLLCRWPRSFCLTASGTAGRGWCTSSSNVRKCVCVASLHYLIPSPRCTHPTTSSNAAQIRIFLSAFLEHHGHGVYQQSLPWTEPTTHFPTRHHNAFGQSGLFSNCVFIHYQWIRKGPNVLYSHLCSCGFLWSRFFSQTKRFCFIHSDFSTPFCS